MAFGFTPYYEETFSLNNLSPGQFLVLAKESVLANGWVLDHISNTGLIAHSTWSLRSWGEQIKIIINGNEAIIRSETIGNQMYDWGRNKKNTKKFLAEYKIQEAKYSPLALGSMYVSLLSELVPEEKDILKHPDPNTAGSIKSFLHLFMPSGKYFITPLLVDINILVFILMVLSGASLFTPDNATLLAWGANFRPMTLDGQWWRLITNFFLHFGIIHLALNMFAFIYIGLMLEPRLGRKKFLAAYLLSGIAASVTSLAWHNLVLSAGASGAIFGMYGVFLALLTTNLIHKSIRKELLYSMSIFVGYNLIYGLKGNIDSAAHIGGLLSGILIGYAYYPALKKPEEKTLTNSIIAVLAVLVISGSTIAYFKIPDDVGKYYAEMKIFQATEAKALAYAQKPDSLPEEKALVLLKDSGIDNWNKDLTILYGIRNLNLPAYDHKRNEMLIKYCNYRLKDYSLRYRALKESSSQYNDSINFYTHRLKEVLDSVNNEKFK